MRKAILLFCAQGYAATSPDELMQAMSIGRQSMYDTFGAKRQLFLTALDTYVAQSCDLVLSHLQGPATGLAAIRSALLAFCERDDVCSGAGCMAMNAISEFGTRDPQVLQIMARYAQPLRALLLQVFAQARESGELAPQIALETAVAHFDAALVSIRVIAKMGGSAETLAGLVDIHMRGLLNHTPAVA